MLFATEQLGFLISAKKQIPSAARLRKMLSLLNQILFKTKHVLGTGPLTHNVLIRNSEETPEAGQSQHPKKPSFG